MTLLIILLSLLKINITLAIYYTNNNSMDIFEVFKEKYNKRYVSAVEEETRLKTFVKNLNIVEKLNENQTDRKTFFILNQYADLNPEAIDEQYAIKLQPFYNVNNKDEAENVARQKDKELNTSQLFNLDKASELYNDFMKNYKKNYTKKRDRATHFYRFVKTLVEINKNNFNGNTTLALDENADAIKEPNEYFY